MSMFYCFSLFSNFRYALQHNTIQTRIILKDKYYSTANSNFVWLNTESTLIGANLNPGDCENLALESAGRGLESAVNEWQRGLPFRYSDVAFQNYVKTVSRVPKEATYKNYEELLNGINNGTIRPGQFIYGAMKLSEVDGHDFPKVISAAENYLSRAILRNQTGEAREVPCFHVAVYVGKYADTAFVVENPGSYYDDKTGLITLQPLRSAFHNHEGPMFVVSPMRDDKGKSTRYHVIQRALACVGLKYKYHIRHTNCECFALALMGEWGQKASKSLIDVAVQSEALAQKKSIKLTEAKKAEDEDAFQKFFADMRARIKTVPDGVVLTLKYFIKKCGVTEPMIIDDGILPSMILDYNKLFEAIEKRNLETVKSLIESGLSHSARNRCGKTPSVFAYDQSASTEIIKYLNDCHKLTNL